MMYYMYLYVYYDSQLITMEGLAASVALAV